MQTVYTVFPDVALAGQLGDPSFATFVRSYIAKSDITPGTFVELNSDGTVQMAKTSGAGEVIEGVAVLRTAGKQTQPLSVSSDYKAGDVVPVLRRGQVWVLWAGSGTPALGSRVNVSHHSTTATQNGYGTDAVPSLSADAEVSPVNAELMRTVTTNVNANTDVLALVELNLPALWSAAIGPTGATV